MTDHKEMPRMTSVRGFFRKYKFLRVAECRPVEISELLSSTVPLIQILELHREQRGLDRIESSIYALPLSEILAPKAIIPQQVDFACNFGAVRYNGTTVTIRAKILGWVKTERGAVP